MIVYGDPSERESFSTLVERLRKILSASRSGSLDDTRAALIQAGMLEQAVEDAGEERLAAPCRAVTDLLAEAFLDLYQPEREPAGPLTPAPLGERGRGEGQSLPNSSALASLPADDRLLTVKLPEGFAFYALYPEAYVHAAERWLADHPQPGRVLVVGVRSIGTTLSAVVAATLQARGVEARRLTLRPTGHPFARETHLAPEDVRGATCALIVDEGPGLSGSSMAAAAEACVRVGIARDRIAFLPGHGNGPGGMASDAVLGWWCETPRVVVPTEALCWAGRTLQETLAEHGGGTVEELTGGRWRALACPDDSRWPAVVFPFERRKLLVTRADGSATLYKFVGLSVPGTIHGFAAAPWIEGEALTRDDASPELISMIGRHIERVAGPPLSTEESRAARERLEEMVRVNLAEAGIEPLTPTPLPRKGEGFPSAGDYRLAPWEWRRLPGGEIVKAGRIAPTGDHTVVGRQPIAWDVAGAMVEWGRDDPAGLPPIGGDELRFYFLAYAAFRMGMCTMFAGDNEEGERLRRAAEFYRRAVERMEKVFF